jgi:hypothetical protein
MHNHSKDNYIILKGRVNDPGLALIGKVGIGPFWNLVQVLSYVHVLQPSAPSSPPSGTSVKLPSGRLHEDAMQYLIDGFDVINHKTTNDNHGVHG